MKKIVLKLYEFDELSKDSQERIIEREHWNVMEQCMDAYGIDYKKSMKAFEDMTDTKEVYKIGGGYHVAVINNLTGYGSAHLCTYNMDLRTIDDLKQDCYKMII